MQQHKSMENLMDIEETTHDFGFTFADENDVVATSKTYNSNQEEIADLRKRLADVKKMFMPLLINLSKDPNKPMIKWPNRKAVLDEQIKKLDILTSI